MASQLALPCQACVDAVQYPPNMIECSMAPVGGLQVEVSFQPPVISLGSNVHLR